MSTAPSEPVEWLVTGPYAVDRPMTDKTPFEPCDCDWEVMTYRHKGDLRRRFLHADSTCPRFATDWSRP